MLQFIIIYFANIQVLARQIWGIWIGINSQETPLWVSVFVSYNYSTFLTFVYKVLLSCRSWFFWCVWQTPAFHFRPRSNVNHASSILLGVFWFIYYSLLLQSRRPKSWQKITWQILIEEMKDCVGWNTIIWTEKWINTFEHFPCEKNIWTGRSLLRRNFICK